MKFPGRFTISYQLSAVRYQHSADVIEIKPMLTGLIQKVIAPQLAWPTAND
ncbi:MAG: hypothetical protein F6K44_09710 [Moorea sp. SIO3E2]|nr:hypothetical protein [Moorena sp. SIO3E2]